MHTSALKQITGEAEYIDDIPKVFGELSAAIVGSTIAHGRILSVDPSEALKMKGVCDYVSAKDVPKKSPLGISSHHDPNMIGPVFRGID